ncbi:MAG TPA: hypothetical protein VGE97_05825 [Nitrososphaera sp.]
MLCALFLTISGSAHAVAFSLQPSIQTIQQGIPSSAVPGQQQQQPQARSQPSIPHQLPPYHRQQSYHNNNHKE